MKVGVFKIKNKLGLHARPAARLVNLANEVNIDIVVVKGNKKASARSIIDLLSLSCRFDDQIRVEVDGKDENKVFNLVCRLLETEVGERINGKKI